MKIELDDNPLGNYRIDSYSRDGLVISETRYTGSVIVMPDSIIDDWPPRCFADLAVQHVQTLADLGPEILLLGTGARLRFPEQHILAPLTFGNIGYEIMDTGAACRAYNFLSAEGRRVVAALLQISEE
ncbi:MAG: Mth938-like domain-containing protein [Desulfuromonadales bacterium]|jgi:uncharacterized protein